MNPLGVDRAGLADARDTTRMKGKGEVMRALSGFLAAFLLLVATGPLHAQPRTVSGTVRAQEDGRPLAEVTVRLRGAIASVRTDAAGAFRIELPAVSSGQLIFSHPERDLLEVELLDRRSVDVVLRLRARYNQYGVRVDRTPLDAEARDGLLVFESADGDYRFWFDMRANLDGAVIMGDELNENGSGAEVRRARIGVKAQFRRHWYGEVDMDFADSRADLKDAYLKYSPTESFSIKWGNAKEIFSLEQNTTSRYLVFMERPMVTRAMTPSRTLGMQAVWNRPYLLLAGGVHFQDVGGWEEVQVRKDNNADIGRDEGYSLTGKVILMPGYYAVDQGIHIGLAGSYRTPKTHDDLGTVRFDTRGPANVNRRKYLDTDRMEDVDHWVLGGLDLAAYRRGLRLQAEYTTAEVTYEDPDLAGEHFNGFYVQGSAMLFGGRYQYNAGDGEFTQPTLGGRRGDVELGLRYEYLDLNSRAAGVMGGAGDAWTVGVNYYPNSNVKFMLNYAVVNHDRYANGRGRLFSGLDAAGNLTRDPLLVAAPDGEAGEDYRALAVRVQVSF